jgi:hypothetical protein
MAFQVLIPADVGTRSADGLTSASDADPRRHMSAFAEQAGLLNMALVDSQVTKLYHSHLSADPNS